MLDCRSLHPRPQRPIRIRLAPILPGLLALTLRLCRYLYVGIICCE